MVFYGPSANIRLIFSPLNMRSFFLHSQATAFQHPAMARSPLYTTGPPRRGAAADHHCSVSSRWAVGDGPPPAPTTPRCDASGRVRRFARFGLRVAGLR